MPAILSACHASPPHRFTQEFLKAAVVQVYSGHVPDSDIRRIEAVFDHSRIRERAFMMPLDWYVAPHSPEERNRIYMEKGLEMLARASRSCLEAARCAPEEVSHIIFVTTTGFSTPSLDGYLVNELGLPRETNRLPIWGLGCAGGAAGISRAYDLCLAHPEARVLLVSLEACSLNFARDDISRKNLVAMSLFADTAAAVLVAGDGADADGPLILATRSHLFPDTYRIMGWDVGDGGFSLVLSPELPSLVRKEVRPLVDSFLLSRDLTLKDVVHFLAHPGGAKVVDSMREALGLSNGCLRHSEDVLADFGNVSSASVLIVLERWLAGESRTVPGYGLLSAFGPGFSAELVLLHS